MLERNDATLLVAELHHRVMNSFQIISALARRCGRVGAITDLAPVVDDLTDRVAAFGDFHRQLARPPSGCFAAYCSTLGTNLVAAFGRSDVVRVTMEQVDLPSDHRARIALIIAELLTNCLKHSLATVSAGTISLTLQVFEGRIVIEAQDSAAPSLPQRPPKPSRVVSALSASLGGDARVIDRGGYCAQVSLPLQSPLPAAGHAKCGVGLICVDEAPSASRRRAAVEASNLTTAGPLACKERSMK